MFANETQNISVFYSASQIDTSPGIAIEQEISATGTISQHHQNQMLSSHNPSTIVNAGTEMHTETAILDVTHLTEADQEFSQDFDENFNTARQMNKKKPVMVKPSEMLGSKAYKNSSNKERAH